MSELIARFNDLWEAERRERQLVPHMQSVALVRSETRVARPVHKRFERQCDVPGIEDASAREEVRDSGRDHESTHTDTVDRLPRIGGVLLVAVGDWVLEALERLPDGLNGGEPLQACHPVPAGDDEPEREAVLQLQRVAVHLVGEQDFLADSPLDPEAPRMARLPVALDPAFGAVEDDLGGFGLEASVREQVAQRCPGPLGGADPPATGGSQAGAEATLARCPRTPA